MILYRVMDEVFRSWSHVAVLRALIDRTNGCTGNETARISGMHPRSAIKALGSLEELGIVNRQRGGRDHLFSLNRDHVLVKDLLMPLYKTESLFPHAITKEINSILKRHVISAVIFGSVARREEKPQSDLDLCCIVNSVRDKILVRELLNKKSKSMNAKYGIKIAPVFFTENEFKNKRQVQLIKEIISQGVLVVGKNPRTLIDG
ncbi:MAG: nucleotidyltransferase domain-containing protein [Ignavibacteriales bacterium]|nr:nucleotidyltransferase domain-containing protein [Ignavibacteriales bacterium]